INGKYSLATEVRMNMEMRNLIFSRLQELSFDFYNQNSVGYIHSRVMSDTSRIGELFTWQIGDALFFLTYIVGAIVVMFRVNARLTWLILIIVPVIALFFVLFQGRIFELNRQVREINSRISGSFNEGITGAKTIKTLVIEKRIDADFMRETGNMYNKSVAAARQKGLFTAVTNFATSVGLAIVLWKGGVIARTEVGTFALFMSYVQGIMEPVRYLVESLAIFVMGKVNISRFAAIVEAVSSVTDSPEVIEKYGDSFNPRRENWEPLHGDIEFENVDFKYPDGDEYVLENFSLRIPFGTHLAIVGETGAGKSTLVNLVCRFFEPTKGRVLIDGRDARERSQLWLHSSLGYVLQTPHLFSGTVRENLLYGNPGASDGEIYAALDLVCARELVGRLGKGLDSDVGEGGDLLSAGEKQLLSFARAILADPKILVLDEATASVDTITEQKIQKAMEAVIKGRTSLVIAHRLSTVKNADLILVVSEGKIIEQGCHSDLLNQKGHYYKLWKRQYEEEATGAVWSEGA
ncbi:MAG TPA: ABC transporter ATP-binding protein, partial [Bacillota bacterium]|nr:ABC transporter ATP-binding protein [Bacillota bacterium]